MECPRYLQFFREFSWILDYSITLSDIRHNGLKVSFATLPKDIDRFAEEVYDFCPDIVDQGYGCMDEMLEMADETGQPLPPEIPALIEGIDLTQNDFGLEILKKDLSRKKSLTFWWD